MFNWSSGFVTRSVSAATRSTVIRTNPVASHRMRSTTAAAGASTTLRGKSTQTAHGVSFTSASAPSRHSPSSVHMPQPPRTVRGIHSGCRDRGLQIRPKVTGLIADRDECPASNEAADEVDRLRVRRFAPDHQETEAPRRPRLTISLRFTAFTVDDLDDVFREHAAVDESNPLTPTRGGAPAGDGSCGEIALAFGAPGMSMRTLPAAFRTRTGDCPPPVSGCSICFARS